MRRYSKGEKVKTVYTPAIFSFAKDGHGKINHVEVIRLGKDGDKNRQVNITKQTYGAKKGYAIELNRKSDKSISYLAE